MTSRQKKIEELLVGFKEKELWPDLKMCYEVPIHVYKQNYILILIAD